MMLTKSRWFFCTLAVVFSYQLAVFLMFRHRELYELAQPTPEGSPEYEIYFIGMSLLVLTAASTIALWSSDRQHRHIQLLSTMAAVSVFVYTHPYLGDLRTIPICELFISCYILPTLISRSIRLRLNTDTRAVLAYNGLICLLYVCISSADPYSLVDFSVCITSVVALAISMLIMKRRVSHE